MFQDSVLLKGLFEKKIFILNFLSVFILILFLNAILGMDFALGYLSLIIIHELGHIFSGERLGYRVKSLLVLPIMAVVTFDKNIATNKEQAIIGICGPLFEGILSVLFLLVYYIGYNQVFLALSFLGLLKVLFNLIPFSFLDGGKIISYINYKLRIVGTVIFSVILLLSKQYLLLLLSLLLYSPPPRAKDEGEHENRRGISIIYLSLLLVTTIICVTLFKSYDIRSLFQSLLKI